MIGQSNFCLSGDWLTHCTYIYNVQGSNPANTVDEFSVNVPMSPIHCFGPCLVSFFIFVFSIQLTGNKCIKVCR